jgi:hypothetical protein
MITNNHSWSLEPSSNKRVEDLSGSFICNRSSSDHAVAKKSGLAFTVCVSFDPSSRFAKRTSLIGQQIRGRLGKPIPPLTSDRIARSKSAFFSCPDQFGLLRSLSSLRLNRAVHEHSSSVHERSTFFRPSPRLTFNS